MKNWFSSLQLESSINRDGWIDIPDQRLDEIIDAIRNKESTGAFGVRNSTNFDLQNVKRFLSKTEFRHYQMEIMDDTVKRLGSGIGNITTQGIDRFLGYVNSVVYQPTERIPIDQVRLLLLGADAEARIEDLIENIRGQIRTGIYDAFNAIGWDVEFDYNRSVLTDLGTLESTERVYECLINTDEQVALGSKRISIRMIVPIRTVISPSTRGQPLIFRILPSSHQIHLTSRFIPLQGLDLSSQQMINEFQNLFIERSQRHTIPLSHIVMGNPTSRFNEKVEEIHDDYVFLYDNLQHERENMGYIGRRLTGGSVEDYHQNIIICPVLLIDGEIITEDSDGNQNLMEHLVFKHRNHCFHVIDRRGIESFADTLLHEWNSITTWIGNHI